MVTNGITYGVTSIQSESVSYQKKGGELTTVKSALDELINTSLTKIDTLEEKVSDYKKLTIYLADNAKVGDYVAYDAGDWETSTKKPTEQGEFGGNDANTNKGYSVSNCGDISHSTSLNGWRVLKNDGTTVTLVHAGQPECYYHSSTITGSKNASAKLLDERSQSIYVNPIYADSAHALNYEEALAITGNGSPDEKATLRAIGSAYYLATPNSNSERNTLLCVNFIGSMNCDAANVGGFRPVVVLKPGILTTGQEPDKVGNEKAWTLVAPTA